MGRGAEGGQGTCFLYAVLHNAMQTWLMQMFCVVGVAAQRVGYSKGGGEWSGEKRRQRFARCCLTFAFWLTARHVVGRDAAAALSCYLSSNNNNNTNLNLVTFLMDFTRVSPITWRIYDMKRDTFAIRKWKECAYQKIKNIYTLLQAFIHSFIQPFTHPFILCWKFMKIYEIFHFMSVVERVPQQVRIRL